MLFLEQYIHFNVSAIYPVVRKVSGKTVDVTIYLRTNVSYRSISKHLNYYRLLCLLHNTNIPREGLI